MIFKNLFKPKFQDPNPQVRLNAIESLSPEQAEQKTRLHELAFNDEDANVNLAALTKLNSFALWCKTAEIAKTERVRKKAQSMVEAALFDSGELDISDTERKQFIKECKSIPLLEKTLKLNWLLNDESGLLLNVLDKIGKIHLTKQVLLNSESETVQQQLLAKIEDQNLLNKILKKTRFASIKEQARLKLEAIEQAKTKPIDVEKRARLVLSQLLALKDHNDLESIRVSMAQHVQVYEQISTEFDCLRTEIKLNLQERFEQIVYQVNRQIERLLPQWQTDKERIEIEDKLSCIEESIDTCIKSVNKAFAADVSSITLGDVEKFENTLQSLQNDLDSLRAESVNKEIGGELDNIHKRVERGSSRTILCRSTLSKLPEFQQNLSSAQSLYLQLCDLTKPNDFSQIEASKDYLKEQKSLWQELKTPFAANWPGELQRQWSDVVSEWNSAIEGLQATLKQKEAKCRSKLKAIEGMIQQGKYKAAIGLFSKTQALIESLPDKSQASLSRSFSKVTEQIENLKDWQAYIAQPRKPALLDEVEQLPGQNLSIEQQAKEVKRLRHQWNSLGNIESEADTALNLAFDQAIEKAFAPCREYFAEQEKQRDNNAKAKLAIIEQLQTLDVDNIDDEQLSNIYNDLQKSWKRIGKIDYKVVEEFNQKYRTSLQPLRDKVSAFHKRNAEAKQALIKRLANLIEAQDSVEASEQAKKLQKSWKVIPYAGDKAEKRLWSEFRKLNDTLFSKRQTMQEQTKAQLNLQKAQFENALNQCIDKLNIASRLSDVDETAELLSNLIADEESFEQGIVKSFLKNVKKVEQDIALKRQQFINQSHQDDMARVFSVLEHSMQSDWTDEQVRELPKQWRNAFNQGKPPEESRADLNILLDITADQESPKEELARRQELQLQRLGDKFDGGRDLTSEDLLLRWIQHGKVLAEEKPLLERLKSHFSVE
ncbi:MAG: hypothetical protein Alis2KO_02590 [Aliiglaciecola sp.]